MKLFKRKGLPSENWWDSATVFSWFVRDGSGLDWSLSAAAEAYDAESIGGRPSDRNAYFQAKRWAGIQIKIWTEGIQEGTFIKYEILEDLPEPVRNWTEARLKHVMPNLDNMRSQLIQKMMKPKPNRRRHTMNIEELIKKYGRDRIERAVTDLKPGGELEGTSGRVLNAAFPVEHAVLEAVGADNREFNPPIWEPGLGCRLGDNVQYRIPEDYNLPDPVDQPADDGVNIEAMIKKHGRDRILKNYRLPAADLDVVIPRDLVDALNEAVEQRRDLAIQALRIADHREEARAQEAEVSKAIIDYIKGDRR